MMLTPDDQIEAQLAALPQPEAAPPPSHFNADRLDALGGAMVDASQMEVERGQADLQTLSDGSREISQPDLWRNDIKPNFNAAMTRAFDLDNAGSDSFVRANAYAPVVEAINAGRPWADRVPNPYHITPLSIFDDATAVMRGQPLTQSGMKDLVWQRVHELRTANPGLAGNIPQNEAELEANVLAGQRADADWAATVARNSGPIGGLSQFVGGAIGGLTDPINLAGSAIGFPETSVVRSGASQLLRTFLREGAINGVIDLAGLPGRMSRYDAIGEPYTAEQAAEEVGGAALLGGLIPAGIKGAGMFADLDRRSLLEAFDAAHPDPSPTARTARALVEDDAHRAEQNPFTPDAAGEDLHRTNLMETMRALDAGRVDLVPHVPIGEAGEAGVIEDHTGGGFHTEAEEPPVRTHPKPPQEENLKPFGDPARNIEPFRQQSEGLARELASAPQAAPIVQFRRDFAEIEKAVPPAAEGMTRLWRGNRPGEVGLNPNFTNDAPGIALPFRKAYGGDLSYVDVPTSDLGKYESKVAAAPGAEFRLPEEIASQAKAVGAKSAQPEFGVAQGEIDALRSLDQKTAIAEQPQLGLLGDGHSVKTVTSEIERQARAVERLRGCVTGGE